MNTEAIAQLLRQTGRAHHQAFLATDGEDPDWAGWYADYLSDKLPPLLGASLPRAELLALLVELDAQHRAQAPSSDWTVYYAQVLAERFA